MSSSKPASYVRAKGQVDVVFIWLPPDDTTAAIKLMLHEEGGIWSGTIQDLRDRLGFNCTPRQMAVRLRHAHKWLESAGIDYRSKRGKVGHFGMITLKWSVAKK